MRRGRCKSCFVDKVVPRDGGELGATVAGLLRGPRDPGHRVLSFPQHDGPKSPEREVLVQVLSRCLDIEHYLLVHGHNDVALCTTT